MTAGIPPFAEMEYDARPELRDYGFPSLDADPFNKDRLAKKPCIWLENGSCKHYEDRPDMCQHFQFGGFECNVIREIKGYDPIDPHS